MSQTQVGALASVEAGRELHRKKTGWLPVIVLAGITFAFVLGFGDRAATTAARVVLALGGSAAAVAVVLVGQVLLTLRGRRRFPYLEDLPTHEALEEEKAQILMAIKEIEFDHDMNKINDRDYGDLRARYEAEAFRVLKAIDEERARWDKRARSEAKAFLEKRGLGLSPVRRPAKKAEAKAKTPGDVGPEERAEARAKTPERSEPEERTEPGSKAKAKAPGEVRPKAETPPESAGDTRRCPSCDAPNDADADFCTKCGSRIEPAVRTCAGCGTENDPDARFCKRCGNGLGEAAS